MSQNTAKIFTPLTLRETASELPHDEARQGESYLAPAPLAPARMAYLETYGCQMNFSDTEIVASVLQGMGYGFTREEQQADLVLLNTCAIRENAEEKIWNRLTHLKGLKRKRPGLRVGVLGCMAERLKTRLLDEEGLVDLVVGPDAYRTLPELLEEVHGGARAINVLLSREETYADLPPLRLDTNGVSAFVSIMRGCNNMCSFCVVPFTRGRERSRHADSIVKEVEDLVANGYREVTLLGQNVDSYRWEDTTFAGLLARVAQISAELRIRFSTSHPKDMTDDVLETMASHANIAKYIHLPVQSGSSRILELMNRGHTREWYLQRIARIREYMPTCGISTDIITGFCSETDTDHADTLSLMEEVGYDYAFMFHYSERPGTLAARKLADDVPESVKRQRLTEVIALQNQLSFKSNHCAVGNESLVLVEGDSKRSAAQWAGRNDANKVVVFDKHPDDGLAPGRYCTVMVTGATSATLTGRRVPHTV